MLWIQVRETSTEINLFVNFSDTLMVELPHLLVDGGGESNPPKYDLQILNCFILPTRKQLFWASGSFLIVGFGWISFIQLGFQLRRMYW